MASRPKRSTCSQAILYQLEDSDSDVESLVESSDSDAPPCMSSDSESESESEPDITEVSDVRMWCQIDTSQAQPATPPPRFPFTGAPGQKVQCDHNPLSYLQLFFDDALIERIVEETNRYTTQQLAATPRTSCSRANKWEPVTKQDIWLFLSLVILQGIVGKPLQRWYWSTNRIIATPFFSTVMSECRFSLIMKFLHFTNNEEFDEASHPAPKLKKIWEIYQMLNTSFKKVYVPARDVTVDESMLAYKGRLSWIQFIASKRARFGIKTFMLCEAESGYIWNSVIYTGKGTQFDPQYSSFGVATSSVLSLLEPLLDQGYCLTTDNFYTSPELYEYLIQHKTDAYGTVRANRRELPPNFAREKLKPGDIRAWQKGKMMAMRWKDKKDVCLMSTVHNTSTVQAKNRAGKEILKPKVVTDYNKTMGGVDRADQAMTFYPAVRRQQRKYYKKIFRHLLEQSLWNAFVLYKKNCERPMPHAEFVWRICEAICLKFQTPQETPRAGRRASYSVNPGRLTARHFVEHIPPTPKKQLPTRMCVVCCSKVGPNGKKVRKETRFWCPDCDVGLCVPCFKIYHTREVY